MPEPIVPAMEKNATDCPLCSPAIAAPSGWNAELAILNRKMLIKAIQKFVASPNTATPIASMMYMMKSILLMNSLYQTRQKKICKLAVADVRVRNDVNNLTSIPNLFIRYGPSVPKKDAKNPSVKCDSVARNGRTEKPYIASSLSKYLNILRNSNSSHYECCFIYFTTSVRILTIVNL